jgi:hypothetical protein
MSIDYDVIHYETAVAMQRKVGSHYVHVCSQSLTIQLGSIFTCYYYSAPWNHILLSKNNKQAHTIAQVMHPIEGTRFFSHTRKKLFTAQLIHTVHSNHWVLGH